MNSSSGSTGDIYCSEQSSFNWVNKKVCGMLLCYAVRLSIVCFVFVNHWQTQWAAQHRGDTPLHSTHLLSPPRQTGKYKWPAVPASLSSWVQAVARQDRRYQRYRLSVLFILNWRWLSQCPSHTGMLSPSSTATLLLPSLSIITCYKPDLWGTTKVLQSSQGYMRHLGTS